MALKEEKDVQVFAAIGGLKAFKDINEDTAEVGDLMAARRALDDFIRERKEVQKHWTIPEEDLPNLTTLIELDKYLQQNRYESRYWKDSRSNITLNPNEIQGKMICSMGVMG